MIIQNGKIVSNKDNRIRVVHMDNANVYFIGLIFTPGKLCGEESIISIMLDYYHNDQIDFNSILGNYFIFIDDYKNDKQIIFSANNSVFKAYVYNNCISTSLLELIDHFDDISIDSFNYEAVNEFLHFGFSYFDKTLIKHVNKLDGEKYYAISPNVVKIKNKGCWTVDSPSKYSVNQFFSNLIYATQNLKISLDLTGGVDSRLILSFAGIISSIYTLSGSSN